MKRQRQWGGHLKGRRSPASQGSGPVAQLRAALRISQGELARRAGCSKGTIALHEQAGTFPRQPEIQSRLRGLAAEAGVTIS